MQGHPSPSTHRETTAAGILCPVATMPMFLLFTLSALSTHSALSAGILPVRLRFLIDSVSAQLF